MSKANVVAISSRRRPRLGSVAQRSSRRGARESVLHSRTTAGNAKSVRGRQREAFDDKKSNADSAFAVREHEVRKEDLARQSFPQKVFSAIWAVESEVNNGGFSQYFLNSSAETASFVIEALRTIGASDAASICERAINAAFPSGLPASEEAIRSSANDFPDDVLDKLEDLDQEFFSYPNDVTDLLFAYASRHPQEFGALPKPEDA